MMLCRRPSPSLALSRRPSSFAAGDICERRTNRPRCRLVPKFKCYCLTLVCLGLSLLTGFGATTQVRLSGDRSGTNFVLRWPQAASNFVVESTESLRASNSWTGVSNQTAALAGAEFVLTNGLSSGNQFFRLAQQFDFYGRPI